MRDDERAIQVIIMQPGQRRPELALVHLPKGREDRRYHGALCRAVEAITGNPMEHVTVYTDFGGALPLQYLDMFVNELGRLNDWPRNERATEIYRSNVLLHEIQPPPPESLPWIAGPAVLFKEKVWF